ncbi:MAG: histidine phosphatase family protein [Eubacterium sp.]
MKIYVVRHGQDDDSVRGGWSNVALTDLGIKQSVDLADELFSKIDEYNIGMIISSDIIRTKQTALIISEKLSVPVKYDIAFREVNNGDLAGLNNRIAEEKYPNLYWRKLDWEEHYPHGESPKEFYERISNAWNNLKTSLAYYNKNVLLVTHGGVINVIRCIVDGIEYSNKQKYHATPSAKIVMEIEV